MRSLHSGRRVPLAAGSAASSEAARGRALETCLQCGRLVGVRYRIAPLPLVLAFLFAACSSPSSSPETPAERPGDSEDSSLPEPTTEIDPREPIIAEAIADVLESQHLRERALDEELSREAFSTFIDHVDPTKMFLLEEHIEALRRYEDQMVSLLQSGQLDLAHAVTALMEERRDEALTMIEEHLEEPFDFSRDESLEVDFDERTFAETDEELSDRWRRQLKLEVLQRVDRMESLAEALEDAEQPDDPADLGTTLDDIPETFEERAAKAREDLAGHYQGRFERMNDAGPLEPAQRFVNAIAHTFDPHTAYMPPQDRDNFDLSMSGQFEGIGAQLREDEQYIRVQEVMPGGAAWQQGDLEAGDLIIAVAQEGEEPVDVADMRIDRVVEMIRGPKGSEVTLTVRKPDDSVELVAITRDVVQIEEVYARGAYLDAGDGHEPVGYIRLPSFYGDTGGLGGAGGRRASEDVRRLLQIFEEETEGVILDLRENGGGLLDHARDITGMFIEGGPVVKTRSARGETQVLEDEDEEIHFSGEVVVLVDRFSASASEILAGALQDYERALIVGTSATHGKGTVQMMVDLDQMRRSAAGQLGAFKLTIQQFFRVSGESTQSRGVVPDVTLPDPMGHVESGERYLDNAIPWSEVEPLDYDRWPKSWNPAELASQSEARQEDEPVFSQIRAYSALLKARSERTRVPLAREAWQGQQEQERLMLESVDPDLENGEERFGVEVVEYVDRPDVGPRGDGDDGDEVEDTRTDDWPDELARDPWVAETLYVLQDMSAAAE